MDEPRAPSPADAPPGPPAAPRRRRTARVTIAAVLGLVLALALGLGLAARWMLVEPAGTRWLLDQLQRRTARVQVEGVEGALLGDFQARLVRLDLGSTRWTLHGLRWQGLTWGGWQWASPHTRVEVAIFEAQRAIIERGAPRPSARVGGPPATLRSPVWLTVGRLAIAEVLLPGVAVPVRDLGVQRLVLADVHELGALSARWNGLLLQGEARLEAAAPFALQARSSVRSDPSTGPDAVPAWARGVEAEATARGPLAQVEVQAHVAMQDQRLQARGTLTPFSAAPLARVEASFERVDLARLLAAFTPRAPTTELNGQATARLPQAAGEPLSVSLQLRNAAAGRWDTRRLPVGELRLEARGARDDWTLQRAELAALGADGRPAGRLAGSGGYRQDRLTLALRFDGLDLAALDRRAPPVQLNGPLEAAVQRAPAGTGAPYSLVELGARLQGLWTPPAPAPGRGRRAAAAPREFTLEARARATPQRIELLPSEVRAGGARLALRGMAQRAPEAWNVTGEVDARDFDPRLWWSPEPGSAWATTDSRLNARARLQGAWPLGAAAGDWRRRASGEVLVQLVDSVLAGQALELEATARARQGVWDAQAHARAGSNTARLEARLRPPAAGQAPDPEDRLTLSVDAPDLRQLQAWAQALGWSGLQGSGRLEARARGGLGAWWVDGAPPAGLQTDGQAQLRGGRLGGYALDRLDGRWQGALREGAPIEGLLDLEGLQLAGLTVTRAHATAQGHAGDHRLTLEAHLRQGARTEAAVAASQPDKGAAAAPGVAVDAPVTSPLLLTLQLDGAYTQVGEASQWNVRIPAFLLRPAASATAAPREEALPLLEARDLRLVWRRAGASESWTLEPGRLQGLGASLTWREARWSREGDRRELALDGDVEPFAVAPLLKRLQPDFGWAGDLRVGGRFRLRSTPEVSGLIELQRTGGDLQIVEFGSVQRLGLRHAALRFEAQAGLWRLTQRVEGAGLGLVAGEQTVRTSPLALWPEPQAPVTGRLQIAVENLAAWGVWVPAGWRLGGQASAQLALSGAFGSPYLTGELVGQHLAVRNALEGVALRDGVVRIAFQGESARIDAFRFAAGDGQIELTGQARLGEAPQAQLQLVAQRFALLTRVDRRVVISGDAQVQLQPERVVVRGRVRADEGLVDISRADAPSLSEDVVVRRPGDAPLEDTAPLPRQPGPLARALDLDLVLNLGQRFQLRGRGIDSRLTGELRLTSPQGRLAAHGEIRTVEGKYEAYGQELEIERGVLTFVGALDNPRLDIVAVRPRMETRVGVTVTGSALNPRVNLFSDPNLPDTEKLALLVTGRSYDTLAGNQTLLLQRAAWALLAGDGSGDAGSVLKNLPLDELSVRQTDGAVQETIVSVGKRISERVYVGYERSLRSTVGSWQLIYRVAQRFTLRAQTGEDAGVDLIWIFRWN